MKISRGSGREQSALTGGHEDRDWPSVLRAWPVLFCFWRGLVFKVVLSDTRGPGAGGWTQGPEEELFSDPTVLQNRLVLQGM